MKNAPLLTSDFGSRLLLALFFVSIGSLVYIVFSPLRPLLAGGADYLGRIGLIAVLLGAVWLASRSERLNKYNDILIGLLIMAAAVSLDYILAIFLLKHLGVNGATPAGYALLKLNECTVVVGVIILLTRLSGGSLGSIYLQKGNLRLGLAIGIALFFLAAAGSTVLANFIFKGQDLTLARIIRWAPWLLIFVLANGFQEELLFRGLFLRRLQPFFGPFLSNALIVFVFTLLHRGVTYTSNNLLFAVALIPLGLLWGYITQKTGSIWGSVLFHAGMDLPIMLGIFSNLA